MKLSEKVGVQGRFRLLVTHRDGRSNLIEDHNLVVTLGRNLMARLLTGNTRDFIKYAAIGNGSNIEAVEDSGLTNQINVEISAAEVSDNKAIFRFTIPYDTANGMDVHEFGLVSADGVLFSRRMRQASLVKSNDIMISGEWTVTI